MNFEHEYRHAAPESWHMQARTLKGSFTSTEVWRSLPLTAEEMNLQFWITSVGKGAGGSLPNGLYLTIDKTKKDILGEPFNGRKLWNLAKVIEQTLNAAVRSTYIDDELEFTEAVINGTVVTDQREELPAIENTLYLDYVPGYNTKGHGIVFKICEIPEGTFTEQFESDNTPFHPTNN